MKLKGIAIDIYKWMTQKLGLRQSDLIVFAHILRLVGKEGTYEKGSLVLADESCINPQTIKSSVKRLIKNNILVEKTARDRRVKALAISDYAKAFVNTNDEKAKVQPWMFQDEKQNTVLVFAVLFSFLKEKKFLPEAVRYASDWLGISTKTVYVSLRKIKRSGVFKFSREFDKTTRKMAMTIDLEETFKVAEKYYREAEKKQIMDLEKSGSYTDESRDYMKPGSKASLPLDLNPNKTKPSDFICEILRMKACPDVMKKEIDFLQGNWEYEVSDGAVNAILLYCIKRSNGSVPAKGYFEQVTLHSARLLQQHPLFFEVYDALIRNAFKCKKTSERNSSFELMHSSKPAKVTSSALDDDLCLGFANA